MEYSDELFIGAFCFLDIFLWEKWYVYFGELTRGRKLLKLKLKVLVFWGESGISWWSIYRSIWFSGYFFLWNLRNKGYLPITPYRNPLFLTSMVWYYPMTGILICNFIPVGKLYHWWTFTTFVPHTKAIKKILFVSCNGLKKNRVKMYKKIGQKCVFYACFTLIGSWEGGKKFREGICLNINMLG